MHVRKMGDEISIQILTENLKGMTTWEKKA
jgi:hypothetical protein